MSSPLPLRICCMAAMAPALTEAASQVRIKATLPTPTAPSVTTQTTVLNGKDRKFVGKREITVNDSRIVLDKVKLPTKQLTNLAGHLLKGGHGVKLNTCNLASNLQNLGVTTPISNLHKKEVSQFQTEFVKSLAKLENGGMNQPATKNDITKSDRESKKESEVVPLVNGKTGVPKSEFIKPSDESSIIPQKLDNSCNVVDKKIIEKSDIDIVVKNEETATEEPMSTGVVEKEAIPPPRTREDLIEDVTKTQFQLERRTEFLMRRLRRLQGRQIDTHTRQQLHHFVDYQHRNLETVVKSINAPASGTELKTDLLQSEDVKNLSTAALVNLVRKLQAPKNMTLNQRIVNTTKPETVIQTTTNILKMDKNVRNQSETSADHMCSIIKGTESVVDSDATESSSGGESCDEYDADHGKDRKVPSTPLHRRADWKWATERAGVASRWTWLQAQVSDLEYRIRQHSEIYKQIRNSKGTIVLGDAPSPQNLIPRVHPTLKSSRPTLVTDKKNEVSPCSISTVLSNVDKQASRLSQSLGNCLTPPQNSIKSSTPSSGRSLNGFIDSPIGSSDAGDSPSTGDIRLLGLDHSDISVVDPTTQAARCRPLRSYRKRKLLRTLGLHQTSRKAGRLSSVKCECYPPAMPCPMCGGRYNNTLTVDPDVMPVHERVALLDSSFHPVLSFPQDIPLPAHFEALLKSGEWQNKPPAKRGKLETERRKYKPRGSDSSRKNSRQIRKNAAAVLLSSKIRNKYENKTVRKGGSRKKAVSSRRINKEIKRRAQQLAMVAMKRRAGRSMSALSSSFCEGNQNHLSPNLKDLSLSCPSSTLKDLKGRRNRGESAYDINNIVIPYSIAAATRVEKLQYKEIVTPKWRDITLDSDPCIETVIETKEEPLEEPKEVEKTNGGMSCDEEDEEIEDLTDDIYAERHLKCEVEEKKRFTSFIQYPSRRRNRTETSTPLLEPSSPDPTGLTPTDTQPPEDLPNPDVVMQPIHPPPPQSATPTTPTIPVFSQMLSAAVGSLEESTRRRGSVSRRERLSFSSSAFDDSSQDGIFEIGEIIDPWPLRTFPLCEDDYDEMKKVQPVLEKMEKLRPRVNLGPRVSLEPPNTPSGIDSTPSSSHPCSPLPSSASNSLAGDDPNDPEWTGLSPEKTPKKMSVVLKLSQHKR